MNEKKDQKRKLGFHSKQIEEHHKRNVNYHNKEIDFSKIKLKLFEEGIKKSEEQLRYINKKIEENSK